MQICLPVVSDHGISLQQGMDRAADVAYSFTMDDFYFQYILFLTLFQIIRDKRFQIFWRKWMEIQNTIYF